MPIEIKELAIRAVVSNGNNQPPATTPHAADLAKLKKEIAREVTENVLKLLQQKSER
jgi:hypothetical protein